jgi:hypothetical protein
MANTVIQLKHSIIQGNTPASLETGELSINVYDGKLFYKDTSGTIRSIVGYPGPSGLDGEIQFNNSGILGASGNLKFITANSTLMLNGNIIATSLQSTTIDCGTY